MIWIVLIYMAVMSIIAFAVFGIDKYKARHNRWRIREKTLFLLALLGGAPGAYLGMKVFHHKTLHKKFVIGIPAIMIIQFALIGWYLWINNA